ncbi:MAG: hypothetical protein U9N61_00035 [Euryarchaeota archaeon]|nr:hypothetical protein [Euryarchaeota archaeon]
MKKKDEQMADLGLKELGVKPHIYHFETKIFPFAGITIAENMFSWCTMRITIDSIINDALPAYPRGKATRLRMELERRSTYGVAICDKRDQFNRQRGRTIAKGRLLKHLKQEEEAKKEVRCSENEMC